MTANRECDVANDHVRHDSAGFFNSRNETFCICLFQAFLQSVQVRL